MTPNETQVVEIGTSVPRTVGLIALCVVMISLSVAVAFNAFPDQHADMVTRFIGVIGIIFFGLGTIAWLWRQMGSKGPVLKISPDGIRDRRIAPDTIPWSAIRRVYTWEYSGQRILVLDVDPAVERTLHLSWIARWTRSANRKLGADGLCVATHGLTVGYDELFELVRQRVTSTPA